MEACSLERAFVFCLILPDIFLSAVSKGFDELRFNFHLADDGTQEQYDEIVAHVRRFSPGYNTIANPVVVIHDGQL